MQTWRGRVGGAAPRRLVPATHAPPRRDTITTPLPDARHTHYNNTKKKKDLS